MKLRPGDQVALFAPAGAVPEGELKAGIKILESFGFKVFVPERIFEKHRYLAGADKDRAEELISLLFSGKYKALWGARGGFGSLQILPYLKELKEPPPLPPILIGFSDLTIVLHYLQAKFGLPVWHAPTATFLPRLSERARLRLKRLLLGREKLKLEGQELENGEAIGRLAGGNLASLVSLLGTPYFPDLSGKILILEDTNEPLYRLERLLTQMALAGVFAKLSGLVLGDLCGLPPETYLPIVKELLPKDMPVGFGFKIGHIEESEAFPLGRKARLTVSGGRAQLIEVD